MKLLISLALLLIPWTGVCQKDREEWRDRHILGEEEYELVEKLAVDLEVANDDLIKKMPEAVKRDMLACQEPVEMRALPPESALWYAENRSTPQRVKAGRAFDELARGFQLRGDMLHYEDTGAMMDESLWSRLRRKPFDLTEEIPYYVIYWRETMQPPVEKSPLGGDEIEWNWKFEIKDRLHGVLHVGIEKKKRTFICYDRMRGVYFPEGDLLDRIYRDIVPGMVDPSVESPFAKVLREEDELLFIRRPGSRFSTLTNVQIPELHVLRNADGIKARSLEIAFAQMFVGVGGEVPVTPHASEALRKLLAGEGILPTPPGAKPEQVEEDLSRSWIVSSQQASFLIKIEPQRLVLLELTKPVKELEMFVYKPGMVPRYVEDQAVRQLVEELAGKK